ncbi:D-xylose 1-dehydrogenase Gfo6 [Natronosalvus caseinilyticus]|uniref:D-xylose 1-dehydrogenase Gfo6 n=1 Tax=Natronosalvus caseinilyticus TaxID=2953747 RepID=UPI0028A990C9|nr:D-xylose 1-dehydrogenase Gfo6 [Natronosalvus caseinilyticus]
MELEEHFREITRRDWEQESVDGTVRIAIVGVGGFARNRALPGIEAGEYCETTALVTSSPESVAAESIAADVDHCIDYDAFKSGDYADAYDAVYVSTPNARHGEYAIAAAEQGAHVICEKPLETSVERAQAIVDACEDAGVTLMTAYRHQTEPIVRRAREVVANGVVGDIVQIHASFSHPLLEETDPDTWRLDPELAGGGALVDLGIYPLNGIRFLLECEPVCVYANTYTEPPFEPVDRDVAFQFELQTGATASCTASYDAHASSQLKLVGTDGSVLVSSPFGGVVPHEIRVEYDDVCMEYTGEPTDEVREEFDYFGYCVLTGTTPEPDGEDGVADLAVVEAAYESADERCEVSVDVDRT